MSDSFDQQPWGSQEALAVGDREARRDPLVLVDGRKIWRLSPDCLGTANGEVESSRPLFGFEGVLLEDAIRLREALREIARHSVCCDARRTAERVLAGKNLELG